MPCSSGEGWTNYSNCKQYGTCEGQVSPAKLDNERPQRKSCQAIEKTEEVENPSNGDCGGLQLQQESWKDYAKTLRDSVH